MSVYESTKPDRAAHDAAPTKPYKLLRLPAVMERCALGRSSIYAGVKAGTFVAPVRLSARAVGAGRVALSRASPSASRAALSCSWRSAPTTGRGAGRRVAVPPLEPPRADPAGRAAGGE